MKGELDYAWCSSSNVRIGAIGLRVNIPVLAHETHIILLDTRSAAEIVIIVRFSKNFIT